MKVQFAKTFPKFSAPEGHPLEDVFFANPRIAVVADGITRDSIGCPYLDKFSEEDIYRNYPNPSPAFKAADLVAKTFSNNYKTTHDLEELIYLANLELANLNKPIVCDYLENDLAGCALATAYIENNILHYSYICDCGVIVWNKNGNIRFQTNDDKSEVDYYIAEELKKMNKLDWNTPECRVLVRRDFRNNPNIIGSNGKCISFGALTGEISAMHFIKSGQLELNEGDVVGIYSDGFRPFLERSDFFENLSNIEDYVHGLEAQNIYGSEKTFILVSA